MQLFLRSQYALLLLLLVVFAMSCDKEDAFKNPTPVSFYFSVDNQGTGGSDDLTLNNTGHIVLSSFTVIGERDQAEDFEFSRDFSGGLSIPFMHGNALEDLDFELPQGAYTKVRIRFETLGGNGTNLAITGRFVYQNPQKDPSIVQLNLSESKTFEVDITDALGGLVTNLNESKPEKPQIVLNPKFWFKNVSDADLNNAMVSFINNEQVMTIDENTNPVIYNEVMLKLGMDIKCSL